MAWIRGRGKEDLQTDRGLESCGLKELDLVKRFGADGNQLEEK